MLQNLDASSRFMIDERMEGTTEYCMEFVPGEVDFREAIHPKREDRKSVV